MRKRSRHEDGVRPALRALLAVALLGGAVFSCGCLTDEDIIRMADEGTGRWAARGGSAGEGGEEAGPEGGTGSSGAGAASLTGPEIRRIGGMDEESATAFVCNDWKDTDANGAMDYPKEFIGIKAGFGTGEKVSLCLRTGITRSYTRTLKLWDKNGDLVIEDEKGLEASPAGRVSIVQYEPGRLKAGSYLAVWYVDGREAATARFDVAEEQPR